MENKFKTFKEKLGFQAKMPKGFIAKTYEEYLKDINNLSSGVIAQRMDLEKALGLDSYSEIFKVAESFNQIKRDLGLEEVNKITHQFKDLGINEVELEKIKPKTPIEKPLDKEEIQDELKNLTISALKTQIILQTAQTLDLKNSNKEKWKFFCAGSIVSFIAALLSGLGVAMLLQNQKQPQEKYIVFPKSQTVYGTSGKDTSLVRLVKSK